MSTSHYHFTDSREAVIQVGKKKIDLLFLKHGEVTCPVTSFVYYCKNREELVRLEGAFWSLVGHLTVVVRGFEVAKNVRLCFKNVSDGDVLISWGAYIWKNIHRCYIPHAYIKFLPNEEICIDLGDVSPNTSYSGALGIHALAEPAEDVSAFPEGKHIGVLITVSSDNYGENKIIVSTEKPVKKPKVKIIDIKIPGFCFEREHYDFEVWMRVEDCPCKNPIVGMMILDKPTDGKMYWRLRSGEWREVPVHEWLIDKYEGVASPEGPSFRYGSKIYFIGEGTYRVKIGVGYETYPKWSEIHEYSLILKHVFEDVEEVKMSRPRLYTTTVTIDVRKRRSTSVKLVA